MPKLGTIAIIAVVAVLIFSGVLNISVEADKIPQIPSALSGSVENRGFYEQGRSYSVRVKRYGELFFVSNESNKIQLVLGYVETDADRLITMIHDGKPPKALVPQVELLTNSLERAKKESREASPEVLAANKEKSVAAIKYAAEAFEDLRLAREEYETEQAQLAGAADSLGQEVELLADFSDSEEGEVAGSQDPETKEEGDADASIPLQF